MYKYWCYNFKTHTLTFSILLSEHHPRMDSCDLSFFKNMELFWECLFVSLPCVVNRNEFTSDYSATVICLYASMEKHVLTCVICPCDCNLIHVTLLNLQSIKCRMFWIKLGVAWGFSPTHLLVSFSQVPVPTRAIILLKY